MLGSGPGCSGCLDFLEFKVLAGMSPRHTRSQC